MTPRLNYLELPSGDIAKSRAFYEQALGWKFTEFAPTYASTMTGDTDIGLDANKDGRTANPLPVIEVKDLDKYYAAVASAGGTITKNIFPFPGGRRFHFTDLDGHEIGIWEKAEEG